MLESIEDLRSNRCKLLKDVSIQLEPLIKAIRATIRGREGPNEPLRVPLQDLLDADTRGHCRATLQPLELNHLLSFCRTLVVSRSSMDRQECLVSTRSTCSEATCSYSL
eukprot:m.212558 g.212558  ORF g.212558 m.212558 type:complete len:109 (+) comp17165_c0_seq1:1676-2002(+)